MQTNELFKHTKGLTIHRLVELNPTQGVGYNTKMEKWVDGELTGYTRHFISNDKLDEFLDGAYTWQKENFLESLIKDQHEYMLPSNVEDDLETAHIYKGVVESSVGRFPNKYESQMQTLVVTELSGYAYSNKDYINEKEYLEKMIPRIKQGVEKVESEGDYTLSTTQLNLCYTKAFQTQLKEIFSITENLYVEAFREDDVTERMLKQVSIDQFDEELFVLLEKLVDIYNLDINLNKLTPSELLNFSRVALVDLLKGLQSE